MLRTTLTVALLAATSTGFAATYDAAADFTSATTTNPNGVWSYGYDAAGDGGAYSLVPFDLYTPSASSLLWQKTGYISLNTPAFFKALIGPIGGTATGEVALHPGPATGFANDDAAILRFTAPANGVYAVNSQFFVGDNGDTTAWVILNAQIASPLASLGSTNANPSYTNGALSLSVGDTLDFVVGNTGSYFFDTTPLNVTISSVPEPQAWALWAGGLLAMGSLVRRRAR